MELNDVIASSGHVTKRVFYRPDQNLNIPVCVIMNVLGEFHAYSTYRYGFIAIFGNLQTGL